MGTSIGQIVMKFYAEVTMIGHQRVETQTTALLEDEQETEFRFMFAERVQTETAMVS